MSTSLKFRAFLFTGPDQKSSKYETSGTDRKSGPFSYNFSGLLVQGDFLTGPAQRSLKYGTGPIQKRKMTKFSENGKNPH